MRFRFLALLIGILMLAPLISGCGKEKKEGPPEMVKSPDKKKNPRGLEAPPVPPAPP